FSMSIRSWETLRRSTRKDIGYTSLMTTDKTSKGSRIIQRKREKRHVPRFSLINNNARLNRSGKVELLYLELELHTQSDGRRVLEDLARAEEGVGYIVHAIHIAADQLRYVLANCALRIGRVEPIEREAQFLALAERI